VCPALTDAGRPRQGCDPTETAGAPRVPFPGVPHCRPGATRITWCSGPAAGAPCWAPSLDRTSRGLSRASRHDSQSSDEQAGGPRTVYRSVEKCSVENVPPPRAARPRNDSFRWVYEGLLGSGMAIELLPEVVKTAASARVTRLRVLNYRSLSDDVVVEFGDLTALVGRTVLGKVTYETYFDSSARHLNSRNHDDGAAYFGARNEDPDSAGSRHDQ
jgi:hypothetical protein